MNNDNQAAASAPVNVVITREQLQALISIVERAPLPYALSSTLMQVLLKGMEPTTRAQSGTQADGQIDTDPPSAREREDKPEHHD